MTFNKKSIKFISNIENSKSPLSYFILSAIFFMFLRFFLEDLSSPYDYNYSSILHGSMYWITITLIPIIVLTISTKKPLLKVTKVVLLFFPMIILPPIIDLIITFGGGSKMKYLEPEVHSDLWLRFLTLGGDFTGGGITTGQKVTGVLVILLSFLYINLKTRNILKSSFFAILMYPLVFLLAILPFILPKFLQIFGIVYSYSQILMIHTYLIILFPLIVILFYLHNPKIFKIICKDLRLPRYLFYLFIYILGITLTLKNPFLVIYDKNLFYIILVPIACFFGAMFSIFSNNISDLKIDSISNKNRPLVKKRISLKNYKKLMWFFLMLALIYAIVTTAEIFSVIILSVGGYVLYSLPPFRIKRVFIFSKMIIGFNSVLALILGSLTVSRDWMFFPIEYLLGTFIFVSIGANLIDLKDYEGDKKEGIITLPVKIGLNNAKLILGFSFLVLYLAVGLFFSSYYFIVFLFLGVIQFYLITKKDYNEKPILRIILLTLLLVIYYIFTH